MLISPVCKLSFLLIKKNPKKAHRQNNLPIVTGISGKLLVNKKQTYGNMSTSE